MFICSISGNLDRLQRALKLLDWSRRWIISMQSMNQEIINILKDLYVSFETATYNTFYYPAEELRKWHYTVPEDILLRRLMPEEAEIVDRDWPYRYPGSEQMIRRRIQLNDSLGAIDRSTGKLMGWVVIGDMQDEAMLRVEEEYKQKGVGKLLLVKMAHDRALLGKWCVGMLSPTNVAAQKIGKSLKLTRVDDMHWVYATPKKLASHL